MVTHHVTAFLPAKPAGDTVAAASLVTHPGAGEDVSYQARGYGM